MNLITLDMLPTVEFLQAFYCRAMLGGYVSQTNPNPYIKQHPILDGCRVYEHAESFGEHVLKLTDWWGHGQSGTSIALCDVWGNEVLLWVMRCNGQYEEGVISALKEVLRNTWTAGRFFGGRGPAEIRAQPDILYRNSWYGSFFRFHGVEQMSSLCGPEKEVDDLVSAGNQTFWGGTMIDLPI